MTEPPEPVPLCELAPTSSRRPRQRAPGRDRDHEQPARPRQLKLRVSHDEFSAIAAAARDAGLTPSGYVAEAALAAASDTEAPIQAPWRTALAELIVARTQVRRIGTNINEAARAINVDGDSPAWLEAALTATERAFARLDEASLAMASLAGKGPTSRQGAVASAIVQGALGTPAVAPADARQRR